MKKRHLVLSLVLLSLGFMLAVPTLLRAIPSRYVARLPESLQQLGAPRNQVAILPTIAMPDAARTLLDPSVNGEGIGLPVSASTLALSPATPTPIPISGEATPLSQPSQVPSTPTASPSPTFTPVPIPYLPATRLEGIEHAFQSWNNCGPATLAMTLSYFNLRLSQTETAAILKPNPEDRNVSPSELVEFVSNQTGLEAISRANGDMDTIRRFVSNGIPVILEIGIEPPGEYRWLGWYGHYLLIVAYDDDARQFWVYDSWFGTSEEPLSNAHDRGRILTYQSVQEHWPQFNRTYVAIYQPDQADLVSRIIGVEMDDRTMWQNALVEVRAETAEMPDNAFLWFNLGTIYNALGRYDEAATAFDQARSIGLPWRMLWYQFGPYEAYYQVGRYDDVLLLADTTLKDRPYFEESFYYRALALASLGNVDDARTNLERAIEFNPNFKPARVALQAIEG
jgi:tetratricopeptide (TPR) repeat protein